MLQNTKVVEKNKMCETETRTCEGLHRKEAEDSSVW